MATIIHVLNTSVAEWQAVFAGDQTFQIRENDRDFKVGEWLDLKRVDTDGKRKPMFTVDGVEIQLWVKVTAITRGDQFNVPGRAIPADVMQVPAGIIPPLRPLDPRFVVLAIKRI